MNSKPLQPAHLVRAFLQAKMRAVRGQPKAPAGPARMDNSLALRLPMRVLVVDDKEMLRDSVGATLQRALATEGLALLKLHSPLDPGEAFTIATRDPFAGSPAFVAEYSANDNAEPAWPVLRAGFLGGGIGGDTPLRRLGIDMPAGSRGGPVFDAAGRLAGIALRNESGFDRLMPASVLRARLGSLLGPAAEVTAARIPLDEGYERSLRLALQVIVGP